MKTIRQILEQKGPQVWTVTPEQTVFDALKIMGEKEVGALVVMTDGKLLGLSRSAIMHAR